MKMKSLPKVVYVGIEQDSHGDDYMIAYVAPDKLIEVGQPPRKIGIYRLEKVKTVEVRVILD